MDSILTNIKLILGIPAEYKHFDTQITGHINTVFMTLDQLGITPNDPGVISSELDTWDMLFGEFKNMSALKTYIGLQVRLLFDPPASSAILESINRKINELEWRLNVQTDNKEV